MKEKVAIFVDWDNLRYLLSSIKKTHAGSIHPQHVSTLFASFIDEHESIYRIFFYTALPLSDDKIHKQLTKKEQKAFECYAECRTSSVYEIASTFLEALVREPYIALRCGKPKVSGVTKTGAPLIVQKQVDMLMGLDISEVTFHKHAQKVMIFSKDTDMKPALKMARINGMEVIVANFEEANYLSSELIVHSDVIRTRSLATIENHL